MPEKTNILKKIMIMLLGGVAIILVSMTRIGNAAKIITSVSITAASILALITFDQWSDTGGHETGKYTSVGYKLFSTEVTSVGKIFKNTPHLDNFSGSEQLSNATFERMIQSAWDDLPAIAKKEWEEKAAAALSNKEGKQPVR